MTPSLNDLKPLHGMDDWLSWWPLALGWYAVLALLALIVLLLYRARAKKKRSAMQAMNALDALDSGLRQYKDDHDVSAYLQCVNTVLKQVAIFTQGRQRVASLSGDAWVKYVLNQAPKVSFKADEQSALRHGVYQKTTALNVTAFHKKIKQWINTQYADKSNRGAHGK
ncbi:MAG: DUF4381 domain-containing protein [Pseudomonadota bacterium]